MIAPPPLAVFIACLAGLLALVHAVRVGRGRPALDRPECAHCRGDLRAVLARSGDAATCPSCDHERPLAVRFPRGRRRIRDVVVTILLVLVTATAAFAPTLHAEWTRFQPQRWSTARIVATLPAATPDEAPRLLAALADRAESDRIGRRACRGFEDWMSQELAAGGRNAMRTNAAAVDRIVRALHAHGRLDASRLAPAVRATWGGPTARLDGDALTPRTPTHVWTNLGGPGDGLPGYGRRTIVRDLRIELADGRTVRPWIVPGFGQHGSYVLGNWSGGNAMTSRLMLPSDLGVEPGIDPDFDAQIAVMVVDVAAGFVPRLGSGPPDGGPILPAGADPGAHVDPDVWPDGSIRLDAVLRLPIEIAPADDAPPD